jgi:3-oxoacyl-[acyl-carrier protein] reductase
VRNLAAKGANIILGYTSDRSAKISEDLAQSLQSEHSVKIVTVQADMSSEAGPGHIVTMAKNSFSHPKSGKFQIDIIINNAGVAGNVATVDSEAKEFHHQYNTNVLGPLLLVKAAAPFLPTDRSGRIVNVSSVSATLGFVGQSIYGGTKAALDSMTRTWAREFGENCTVNSINPGPVETEMYGSTSTAFQAHVADFAKHSPGMQARDDDSETVKKLAREAGGRPASADEIAGVVGMLCSAESAWCTGSVVGCNGGMVMGLA